ncbi:NADP-dependent aldehyde dehydrogenase [Catalinimonas alkaloidigena]|uniref:2,5-dioxovalerate dehydrogenase n=1 Tax=Catalinimonas alkaloidigena TaxID=1075417 RepID=A0A1G9G8N1_9BACT|nr:aldehyde dehydrogenase (NADP(+)) [Catalinimonas alkaloidigena]SDK97060.1 NADP-dependent aldehyde dehydrogenase [Catalinimonas alkaloidigena]
MQLTGKNLIGLIDTAEGAHTFTGVDATLGTELPTTFYEATDAEVDRAVVLADRAFATYRRKSGAQKADFLEKIADEIMALGDALLERCHQETALPLGRLQGERGRTCGQLRLFAELLREGSWVEARIDTALPDRQPLPRPDLRQMLIPLGPVAVFGASNFPLAFSVAGGDTASALAAGCSVVVKAHPAHPGTSEMVGRAIRKAAEATGMPEGVFSLVHGGIAPGTKLVGHPLIKAVGFTGSFRGGKALYDAAVRRPEPIPVYAEMGSTNPVFVLPGALKERGAALAQGLAQSVTLGVGQFCTNPGVVVVEQSDEAEAFLKTTGEQLANVAPTPMLTSGLLQAYHKGIEGLKKMEGVAVMQANVADGATLAPAHWLRASVQTALRHPELTEEVFGPSSVGLVAERKEELYEFARQLHGHLTATLHATEADLAEYRDLVALLEQKVGRLIVNSFPTGVEVSHAMNHGGPYPATTDVRTTSVGTQAIKRFVRPLCYQGFPSAALPEALQDANPLNLWRLVNGEWSKEAI